MNKPSRRHRGAGASGKDHRPTRDPGEARTARLASCTRSIRQELEKPARIGRRAISNFTRQSAPREYFEGDAGQKGHRG